MCEKPLEIVLAEKWVAMHEAYYKSIEDCTRAIGSSCDRCIGFRYPERCENCHEKSARVLNVDYGDYQDGYEDATETN